MKLKPTVFFTFALMVTISLVVYIQPYWVPESWINWLEGYKTKKITSSWFAYYVYSVIGLSSIAAISKFQGKKIAIISDVLDIGANSLLKSGLSIFAVLLVTTIIVALKQDIDSAVLGFVLGCYMFLFTLCPIWSGTKLLEMSEEKESKLLLPLGYKVVFYFVSLSSLGLSVYGFINQMFFS